MRSPLANVRSGSPGWRAASKAADQHDESLDETFAKAKQRIGGELVIDQAGATQAVKGQAGDIFVYPSTYLHAVTPVTKGVRRVCVGWVESEIPDAGDRELLFDLENLHASLSAQYGPHSPEMLTVSKLYANLTRRLAR